MWWGVSPHVSLIRSGKDLGDISSTQLPQTLLRAAVLSEMGGALVVLSCPEIEKPQTMPALIFVCTAWCALANQCAHHAVGLVLCFSV